MNTKECIEFLEGRNMEVKNGGYDEYNKRINEVIKRLQMWEDFRRRYGFYLVGRLLDSDGNVRIEDFMDKVEQTHLIKEKMKTYLVSTRAKEHPEWWDTPIYKMKANSIKEIEDKIKNDGRGLEIIEIQEYKE